MNFIINRRPVPDNKYPDNSHISTPFPHKSKPVLHDDDKSSSSVLTSLKQNQKPEPPPTVEPDDLDGSDKAPSSSKSKSEPVLSSPENKSNPEIKSEQSESSSEQSNSQTNRSSKISINPRPLSPIREPDPEYLNKLEAFGPVSTRNTRGRNHPHLPSPGEYIPPRYEDDDNITRMWESPIGPNPRFYAVNSISEVRKGEREKPRNSNDETIARNAMIAKIRAMTGPPFRFGKGKRGIVISIPRNFSDVAFVVMDLMINKYEIDYQIEAWIEGNEINAAQEKWIQDQNGKVILRYFDEVEADIIKLVGKLSTFKKFEEVFRYKLYAILGSSFDEVALYDADMIPMRDPTEMFEHPLFNKYGAVFWFEKAAIPVSNPIWKHLGISAFNTLSQDSGILFLRKSDCWKALMLAMYMNMNQRYYYTYIYGDKDTFVLSFILMNQSYVFVPGSFGVSGWLNGTKLCGGSFAMRDFEGRVFALHDRFYKEGNETTSLKEKVKVVCVADQIKYLWAFRGLCVDIYNSKPSVAKGAPFWIQYNITELTTVDLGDIDARRKKMLKLKNEK